MKKQLPTQVCARIITGPFLTLLSAIFLYLMTPSVYADQLKILPLGDSITQAEGNRASYRYPLWQKLVDAGMDFGL